MQRHAVAAMLLTLATLAAACATQAPQSPSRDAATPLLDTAWVLSDLGGMPPVPHVPVNLRFPSGDAFTASDGCNVLRGAYDADTTKLLFGEQIASTMMACAPAVTQQASAFTAALLQTRSFTIDGSYLALRDADSKPLMTLIAKDSTLPGSAWTVSAYNNGKGAVTGVARETELTAAFGANGRVTGSAGCNHFVADYDSEANKVSIGVPRTTRKACPEPESVMEQEAAFLHALQTAATFRISSDRLELRTADSALAVVLQRRPDDDATEEAP